MQKKTHTQMHAQTQTLMSLVSVLQKRNFNSPINMGKNKLLKTQSMLVLLKEIDHLGLLGLDALSH